MTVRRATVPSDGHLVVYNDSVDGEVVGRVTLAAGTRRNVSVALNESFYETHDQATLVAALYTDEGRWDVRGG